MRSSTLLMAAAASLAACTGFASAAKVTITDDTFVDSATPDNNFGSDLKLKAVSNGGSSMYPLNADGTGSLTHTFVKLPQSFWDAAGTGTVSSATVDVFAFNNSLNAADTHGNVQLLPLTKAFAVGNGTQTPLAGSTTGGATWNTYDGTNKWTTVGGDYDAAATPVTATAPDGSAVSTIASKSSTPFQWDITSLMNNPTTRAELQNFGLMLRVVNETTYNGNDFLSMYSANTANDTAHLPYATVTAVPEPATLGMIGIAAVAGLSRRRARNGVLR